MTDTRLSQGTPPAPPERRRRWPYAVGAGSVLAAAYVALALSTGTKVPADTTVAGVAIGGLSHDAAVAKVGAAVRSQVTAPVKVSLGRTTVAIDPVAAGLAADVPASVDGLTGFTVNPVDLLAQLRGGVDRPLVTRVEQGKLTAAVTAAAPRATVAPKDAVLAFDTDQVTVTPGVLGSDVAVPETVAAIAQAWPTDRPIMGVVTAAEPEVTDAEVATFKAEVADKVISAPVEVKVGNKTFDVDPAALTPALSVTTTGGTPALAYDDTALLKAVRAAGTTSKVLVRGTDAYVTSAAGSFTVVPSVDGVDIDDAATLASVKEALVSDDRLAIATSIVAPAKFTTAQAKASVPTGVISTFTTNFPLNPDRTHNITLAANALNGTYIAPGEQFSLNAHLGQRTAAKGYRSAPVIVNGRLTTDYGGGISQVSTTLFNAVFFSGARIDEFLPHSFYISRYPEGREATVSWPNVDQKFTNTTKGGILIKTAVGPDSITVTFLGRKTYDIESVKGPRVNIVQPTTIRDDREGCVPQSPSEGFDVTVTRIFSQKGVEVKRSSFTTHYIPEDLVICTKP